MRAVHRMLYVASLLGTAVAVPAFAQSGAPSSAPPVSTYPSCDARKPTAADQDAAHGAYMAGKGSFDEADYTTALNYFKDAYRRDCTKHELLVIIARAYELKGDRAEAIHALETYLERAPNAQDAEVQRRRIANLKAQMAAASATPTATATPTPGATTTAPAPTSSAPPAPSGSAPVEATPPPPAEPVAAEAPAARHHSVVPWIVTGVGAAAAITGGVLFIVGSGKISDAEKVCPDHATCNDAAAREKGNSGRTLEGVGVAVGAVGVAAIAGGLIWHFVEPTTPPPAAARVTPDVAPGYAGLRIGGTF